MWVGLVCAKVQECMSQDKCWESLHLVLRQSLCLCCHTVCTSWFSVLHLPFYYGKTGITDVDWHIWPFKCAFWMSNSGGQVYTTSLLPAEAAPWSILLCHDELPKALSNLWPGVHHPANIFILVNALVPLAWPTSSFFLSRQTCSKGSLSSRG